MGRMRTYKLKNLCAGLFVGGAAMLALGIVYVVVTAGHLPAIPLLGHIAGSTRHHDMRALAAIVLAVPLLVGGVLTGRRLRLRSRQHDHGELLPRV